MRPSRPYHAVTAEHREPGGLRRLDFFMDRIMSNPGADDPSGWSILDLACGHGNTVLPLAVMGFCVTGLDQSEAAIQAARQAAQEVGIPLELAVGDASAVSGTFDSVIFRPTESTDDLTAQLASLKPKLTSRGRLFLSVKRGQASYAQIATRIRAAGFWIIKSENATVCFGNFFYRIGHDWFKRGSRLFHFLDAIDHHLSSHWPRAWSDGWLFELQAADEKPLIVQLIPTLGRGGAERIVMQLAERLPQQGFSVMTIAHIRGGDMEKDFTEKNLPHIVLPRQGIFGRWTNFWALRRLLSDLDPAVVHTHLFGSDFWGRLAARSAGIRRIVTTEHNVNADIGFMRTSMLRMLKNLSQAYVAISERVKDYLVQQIGIPAEKIRVIYNGLDLGRIRKRSGSLFHDVPQMISVIRLEPQKNPATMLRALAPIKRPWHLDIVGEGSLEAELKSLAEELKMASRISFLGSRRDVPELLASHDLFLFPSLWEGFGLAVVEAAAAGVPVITSDLPVLRELMDETQVTFLPPDDIEAWALAISSALADPASFLEKARHAAAADWSRFSLERMAAEYGDLYRELLTPSSSPLDKGKEKL